MPAPVAPAPIADPRRMPIQVRIERLRLEAARLGIRIKAVASAEIDGAAKITSTVIFEDAFGVG